MRETNTFTIGILVLIIYLLGIGFAFPIQQIIHKTDGEEHYYLEEMTALLQNHPSTLTYPFFRIGTPLIALAIASFTGLSNYNSIITFNVILYFLLAWFLYWKFIPSVFKTTEDKQFLIWLIAMTNPVLVKYVFSIHPDIILFAILILMCYSMFVNKGNQEKNMWILTILSVASLAFKESEMLLIPFMLVYFYDEYGNNALTKSMSIVYVIAMFAGYFYFYHILYEAHKYLIINTELFTKAPLMHRASQAFDNLKRTGLITSIILILYKLQLTFGLLWIGMWRNK